MRDVHPSDGQANEGERGIASNKFYKINYIYLDQLKKQYLSDMQTHSPEDNSNDEDCVSAEDKRAGGSCSVCSEEFTSMSELTKHMSLHPKLYTCEFCKRT